MNDNELVCGYQGRLKLTHHYVGYYQSSASGLGGALRDWQRHYGYRGKIASSMQEFLSPLLMYIQERNNDGSRDPKKSPMGIVSRAVLDHILAKLARQLKRLMEVLRKIPADDFMQTKKIGLVYSRLMQMHDSLLCVCDMIVIQPTILSLFSATSELLKLSRNQTVKCSCPCIVLATVLNHSIKNHHPTNHDTPGEVGEVTEVVRMPIAAELKRKAYNTILAWLTSCKRTNTVVEQRTAMQVGGLMAENTSFVEFYVQSINNPQLLSTFYYARPDRLLAATFKQVLRVINGKDIDQNFVDSTQNCITQVMMTKACFLLYNRMMSGACNMNTVLFKMIVASLVAIGVGSLRRPPSVESIFLSLAPFPEVSSKMHMGQATCKIAFRGLFPPGPAQEIRTETKEGSNGAWYCLDANRSVSKLRVDWHSHSGSKGHENVATQSLLTFIHRASNDHTDYKGHIHHLTTRVMNICLPMEQNSHGTLSFNMVSMDLLLILQSPQLIKIIMECLLCGDLSESSRNDLESLLLFAFIAPIITRFTPDNSTGIIFSSLHSVAMILESTESTHISDFNLPTILNTHKQVLTVPLHRILAKFKRERPQVTDPTSKNRPRTSKSVPDTFRFKDAIEVLFNIDDSSCVIVRNAAAARALITTSPVESKILLREIRSLMEKTYGEIQILNLQNATPERVLKLELFQLTHRYMLLTLQSLPQNLLSVYCSSEATSLKVLGDGSTLDVDEVLSCIKDMHMKNQLAIRWLNNLSNSNFDLSNYARIVSWFRLSRRLEDSDLAKDVAKAQATLFRKNPMGMLNMVGAKDIKKTHACKVLLHYIFAGPVSLYTLADPEMVVYTREVIDREVVSAYN